MTPEGIKRRRFLAGSALGAAALAGSGRVARAGRGSGPNDRLVYEVVRSDDEWRAMLTRHEFAVLRLGRTEEPRSNPLWNNSEAGTYCCRGCDLALYDSEWKTPVDQGWAFFKQSRENAVLMSIDGRPPTGMGGADTITGGNGKDILNGGDFRDTIDGGLMGDTITGGGGDDSLRGSKGLDNLDGGGGNDTLNGGVHPDICEGGPGTDTAIGCETTTGVP